jgi:hypothetical protein
MAGRRCPAQSCPRIITNGARYCPEHARAYEQKRGTPVERGYDAAHRARRAAIQLRIDAGERIVCATCPTVLSGRAWDLGHDHVRGGYLGPQCLVCNRGEAGRRGRAAQG